MSEEEETTMVRTERQLLRDKRIILLTDEINDEMAAIFMQDIYLLLQVSLEPIIIVLASSGGNVEAGLACIRAIHNAQKEGVKIIGEVHGHAMSTAFLILQVCDERIMGTPCIQMVHGITSFTYGDIRNIDAERKLLTFWQHYFANLLAKRSTAPEGSKYKSPDFWLPILADQTPQFYESEECLLMGLVDRVEF